MGVPDGVVEVRVPACEAAFAVHHFVKQQPFPIGQSAAVVFVIGNSAGGSSWGRSMTLLSTLGSLGRYPANFR
ncbi:MAG: hypothetical protein F4X20_04685 [Dehalococcoidia bacterium]|nr:hypothetical protein [Dehalococcoidia bacterium]